MYYIIKRYTGYEKMPKPALNDLSWSDIQGIAQQGNALDYFNVGDRKAVVLNGTVGAKTFSNQTVYAYILGFNHNASVEGNNTIHFQFGFDALSGGNHIAFCDSNYGSTGSGFRMNTSYTNSGGWSSSYMRNTIIPAFINAMPLDLQNALKTITKYTNNTGKDNTASAVTATQDKVFLLSEYETFGTRSYANQYEQNSQAQYDYYKNGNAKIMYKDTSTSTAAYWWERSPHYDNSMDFCRVNTIGRANVSNADYSYGFAPAFVVG